MGFEAVYESEVASASIGDSHTPFSLDDYDQALVVHNPNCTMASGTQDLLDQLATNPMTSRLHIQPIETRPSVEGNAEYFGDHVDDGTFIIVRAGDGGVSSVLSAIRATNIIAPTLVVAGGKKNDFAHQLWCRRFLAQPVSALQSAYIREVRPILVGISPEDGEETSLDAYCYVSSGISALVAAHANDPGYRGRRIHHASGGTFLAERAIAIQSLISAQSFNASIDRRQGSTPYVDLLAANGSRMAGEFKPGANLLVPGFRLVEAHHKLGEIGIMAALRVGLPIGEYISEEDAITITFGRSDSTYLQIDGEHRRLEPSKVTLSVAQTGVMVLTDRS